MNEIINENKLMTKKELVNSNWYSIEELAELLGFGSGHSMQSNPKILELLNGFSNSKIHKLIIQ